MSLQVVLFEFSTMRGLHGRTVRKWSFWTWLAIYASAGFLLVKMVLHPSAGRWGGLPDGTFFGMLGLRGDPRRLDPLLGLVQPAPGTGRPHAPRPGR